MSGPAVTYTPGPWLAVIGPDIWALIDVTVDDPRVTALWQASAQGLDELLDVLLREGLRQLPGFVVVVTEDGALRYAIRSPAMLEVDEQTGRRCLDASADDNWASGRLPAAIPQLTLRDGSPRNGLELPTAAGITSASSLQLRSDDTAPALAQAQPEVEAPPQSEAAAAPSPTIAEDEGVEQPEPAAEQGNPVSESHASTYYQLLNSSTMDRDALLSKLRDEDGQSGEQAADEEAADEQPDAAALQAPTSDATSVWTAELDESPEAAPVEGGPHAAEQGERQESDATGAVIDGLPWQSPARVEPTAPEPAAPGQPPSFTPPGRAHPLPPAGGLQPLSDTPAPPVEKFDSMSVTINRAALRKQLEEERENGPTVLALRCSLGHLSPTYGASCRVCGAQLTEQNPIEVTRPALGRLAFSDGSIVVLDKGVIFGRFPQSEVEDPAQRPNLVRLVESAEISRMHASIMLDGWQVLLRDLGSQNGTILTLPDHEPEQIRPNEDYVLEPGSIVSFADVVSCMFEVTE